MAQVDPPTFRKTTFQLSPRLSHLRPRSRRAPAISREPSYTFSDDLKQIGAAGNRDLRRPPSSHGSGASGKLSLSVDVLNPLTREKVEGSFSR
jgi:hypothetical protein